MKIIFATGNRGKLREASEILGEGFELFTPADFGITEDIPETGKTLEENSFQKADYLYVRRGQLLNVSEEANDPVEADNHSEANDPEEADALCFFADDTGLEVDALGGAPGVYTARYAGPSKDFNLNMDKVLRELSELEKKDPLISRRARFRSVVTLIVKGGAHQFEGTMEGEIAREKSGRGGFGYDPVFIPDEYPGLTAADITEEQKNAISHRGKALRAMADWLNAREG